MDPLELWRELLDAAAGNDVWLMGDLWDDLETCCTVGYDRPDMVPECIWNPDVLRAVRDVCRSQGATQQPDGT